MTVSKRKNTEKTTGTVSKNSSPEERPACAGLWSTPMVHVNGVVTTCCLDEQLVNQVGNLSEKTLSEIWYSPKMNRWREAQIEGRFADSGPLCTSCNWKSAGAFPKEEAERWLQEYQSQNNDSTETSKSIRKTVRKSRRTRVLSLLKSLRSRFSR